jgi:Cft2 family RNA processing exonuclease
MFSFDKKGIKLNDVDFWLDAKRKTEFSFISHGHADHLNNHEKILATPATIKFHALRARQKQVVVLDYEQVFNLNGYSIQLYPAGHILGSAMIKIVRNGLSLLYSGDFKLRESATAEKIKIPNADILIMESTFGNPEYINNEQRKQLIEGIIEFIQECHAEGFLPIVLAYSLGKSQEAMKIIGDAGFKVKVHYKAWELANIYKEFGIKFNNCSLWENTPFDPDETLLLPPHLLSSQRRNPFLQKSRSVFLSGWASGSNPIMSKATHSIPLSDHADFNDLIEFVKCVDPKKIYTFHGYADFPKYLKDIGYNAEALSHE